MKMNKHILIVTSLLAATALQAQEIKVKDKIVEKSDNALIIGMTFDFGKVKVPADRSLVCTPVVVSGDSIRPLTPVILNGRDRHILYDRTGRTYSTHGEYELRRNNGEEQFFEYTTRTPMAPWMKKSEVALVTDLCGCGWEALQNDRSPLFPINLSEPVVLRPLLAYRTPEAEAVKARSIEGKAFLDFPVNKITIYPDYRNNPRELAAIRATVESVKDDPYATITEVWIKGFASPEGSYANNTYLAENRAKALRDYVKSLYRFEHATFSVDFEPEDWEGLEKRLEEMNLPDKAELLAIIRDQEPRDLDKKEQKLKVLNGGNSYKILLRDVYPALRHSDYVVKYNIRNFTAEEARSLIYTDPKQLSLNEMFMESTYEWLDNLKLKASIGSQGNDNIGNFRYTNTYTIENANGKVSTVFNAKGSENITWETNSNFNAGVEFSFLRGTVSGGVEYFLRKTTDMLLSFPVAPSLGYSSYYANVGDMRNSGVEIELNFTPIRREHVQWDINLNMTHLRNKITMLPSERRTKQVDGYSGYVSGSTFFGEGLPMYTFYMRKYAGVSDEGLSMWYMNETDDKGNPTGKRVTTTEYAKASDYLCGDPIPDLYGGFGTSVNFRGFDLSVAFTYQIGGLAYDSGYSAAMYSPANKTTGMNWHKDILNAWSADNASSNIPRLQYEDKDQNGMSDRFLTDASYLNLQNINFGYTLPSNFTKKVGIEKVRVYLACENVWYWSKRQGFDPRYSYSGSTSQATYSPVRTISGGINIQF